MTTTAERINNAVIKLDWVAPAEPRGVKRAVAQLANHWVKYWNSAERRLAPPLAQAAKLSRYAAWYTRGWALMPAAVREGLPHPQDIDATVWSALEDQLTYTIEGNEAAARAAAEAAKKLEKQLEKTSGQLIKAVVIVGGVATCVLVAYGYARMPRSLRGT